MFRRLRPYAQPKSGALIKWHLNHSLNQLVIILRNSGQLVAPAKAVADVILKQSILDHLEAGICRTSNSLLVIPTACTLSR